MDRRAVRERMAIDRHSAARSALLKDEMMTWFERSLNNFEAGVSSGGGGGGGGLEHIMSRTLLRGSKRKKRSIRSQIQSGALRRALSEDELEKDLGDEEDGESMTDKRLRYLLGLFIFVHFFFSQMPEIGFLSTLRQNSSFYGTEDR